MFYFFKLEIQILEWDTLKLLFWVVLLLNVQTKTHSEESHALHIVLN